MISLTPFTLLITGALVLYSVLRKGNFRLLIWCLVVYLFTFSLEAVGVSSGRIFGEYEYGDTLGLKFLNVPLIIGFNWVIVILGAISIAELIEKRIFLTALLTAILAVIFDFFLEPVAIELNYWQWSGGKIPLQNYYAWFFISFIASVFFDILKINKNVPVVRSYFIIQFIFFAILFVFLVKLGW